MERFVLRDAGNLETGLIPLGPDEVILTDEEEFLDPQPWDRMEDEPILWYQRFSDYISLGPERKISAVYARYRESNGLSPRTGQSPSHPTGTMVLPRGWRDAILRFRWRDRAISYDEHQIIQQRVEFEKERLDERRRRIQLLKRYRNKLSAAIKTLDIHDINWRDAVAGLRIVTEQLRIEYGDMPAQRIEHTGSDGGPIEHNHVITNMSDEELDAKISNYLESAAKQAGIDAPAGRA